jgi:hypothetical protein
MNYHQTARRISTWIQKRLEKIIMSIYFITQQHLCALIMYFIIQFFANPIIPLIMISNTLLFPNGVIGKECYPDNFEYFL